jgi:hypothetical protein
MPGVIARASRYLTIYGAETGERWRQFTRVLASFSDDDPATDVLVDTACATFAALQRWLGERPAAFGGARDARADVTQLDPPGRDLSPLDVSARHTPARDASSREGAPLRD